MDDDIAIGTSDYVSMLGVIVLCTLVGLYHGKKKNTSKDIDGYLLGGRNMSILPVAFSILATKVSGIAVAGGTGEEYLFGASYSLIFIGYFFGQIAVSQLIVPVFRRGSYVSIYEYWEKRFDKSIRILFSLMYLLSNVIYLGIVLYVPAVSITALTGIPYELMVFITGITCTAYCVLGGYEAVIWTDVMQMLIIFISFGLILIKGTINVGGVGYVWRESQRTGFFTSISFSESPNVRYSALSALFMGLYTSFRDLGSSQAGVQRILSVKTTSDAKKTTLMSAFLGLVFMTLLTASAVVLYVNFHDCDPLMRGDGVTTHDQIFVYGIVKLLNHVPCLAGIALSGLICSALSTFSSFINAFATITMEDYMKSLTPRLVDTERKQVLACKILTAFYGGITILFSLVVPFMGGAIKSTVSLLALFAGPMSGVLILAAFVSRCNKKACLVGLLLSLALTTLMQVGGMLNRIKHDRLPHSLDNCFNYNQTGNFSLDFELVNTVTLKDNSNESTFFLFTISFMWYGPIGIVLTVVFGWLASFLSPPQFVDPTLLHPYIAPYTDVPSSDKNEDLKPHKNGHIKNFEECTI